MLETAISPLCILAKRPGRAPVSQYDPKTTQTIASILGGARSTSQRGGPYKEGKVTLTSCTLVRGHCGQWFVTTSGSVCFLLLIPTQVCVLYCIDDQAHTIHQHPTFTNPVKLTHHVQPPISWVQSP